MSDRANNRGVPALAVVLALWGSAALAAHPGPQPRPGPSTQTESADGKTTYVVTPEGHFPPSNPFDDPPGTNFLGDTVFSNMFDGNGVEMPHTLPSTPTNPYNLHPDPLVSEIDPTSPTDDLRAAFDAIRAGAGERRVDLAAVQLAIDVLEGNPIPGRAYSGLPMLHYNGPNKVGRVQPILDGQGNVVGGNVEVHQIWFDSHIESDTGFIDPSDVLEVPWTITYTVDTLARGHDDFAPMVMYFDDPALSPPGMPPMPHVAMDQTFFPMEDGTRTVLEIAMTPGKYYNLTYHWGWRVHPPRVQVSENARKMIQGKTLPEWEIEVFGADPTANEDAKLDAIAMIGDLSPAKRMWAAMRELRAVGEEHGNVGKGRIRKLLAGAERAFAQWRDRTRLPDGVGPDPAADITLFYVNNTIYGHMKGLVDDAQVQFPQWETRPGHLTVKLFNGDYFEHAYVNVDFGGSRGWENTFQSTVDVGGSGPWFTFGRHHWWLNAGAPPVGLIVTPPAEKHPSGHDRLGEHNVDLTVNFDPSRRLRFYQFDPLHHDVAVWSVH
jgi:hypothetical protein